MKTINGYDEKEIIELMLKPLAGGAYKKHPTKSYLTTIDPAYSRERITKVFGLAGIGWGLDWEVENTDRFITQTSKNKDRYNFAIMKAEFWYIMIDDDGNKSRCVIPTTGFSDNDNIGDAMSGARTSCLSTAFRELLFQLHIYKDVPPPKSGKSTPPPPTTEAEPPPAAQSDDAFKQWYFGLPDGAKAAYKAENGEEFLEAISYILRYEDNPHSAKNAVEKFVSLDQIDFTPKDRQAAKHRVMYWKRVNAYAKMRNAGMESGKAQSGALAQVPTSD